MANYIKRESKVDATGQRKKPCCKAGQKNILGTRRNKRAARNLPPNPLGRRTGSYYQKDTRKQRRKISYRQKEKNKKREEKNTKQEYKRGQPGENSAKQEYRRDQTENCYSQAAKAKFVWKVKAGQKKIKKTKINSGKETKEKYQNLYSSPIYQQFFTEAGEIKERVKTNIEKSGEGKRNFIWRAGKAVLKGTAKVVVKGTVKTVKGVAKETIKGSKEFIKADMQSQTGGRELLGSIENGKTLVRSTKTLAKIGIDTGKTMYRSGKKTAKFIAGVRGKNEYSGKGYTYNAENRHTDMSPDKKEKKIKQGKHTGNGIRRDRKVMQESVSANT